MRVGDHRMAGDAQFAAEVEEVVLDRDQRRAHVVRQRFAQQHAELSS